MHKKIKQGDCFISMINGCILDIISINYDNETELIEMYERKSKQTITMSKKRFNMLLLKRCNE